MPASAWLRTYRWGELRYDVIAAVSVAALVIPESLEYAGSPAPHGRWVSTRPRLALLAYALLGRSTVLVVATSSSTAAISASVIAEVNAGHSGERGASLADPEGSDLATLRSSPLSSFHLPEFVRSGTSLRP